MKEIKLKIEGMHCAGCSNRLEKISHAPYSVRQSAVSPSGQASAPTASRQTGTPSEL